MPRPRRAATTVLRPRHRAPRHAARSVTRRSSARRRSPFVADLVRALPPARRGAPRAPPRAASAARRGRAPDFLAETAEIRAGDWTVAPIPPDLQDRRVEITGPVDRKMIINALNSGANVFMADFEDSNSPTWANVVEGQVNLRDAVRGTIALRRARTRQGATR